MEKLSEVVSKVSLYLDERDSAREKAIKASREVVRLSKRVLKHVREEDYDRAREAWEAMEKAVSTLLSELEPYPELLYTGLVYNALSEYAEASIVLGIAEKGAIAGYEELRIPPVPYLQGLADAVGELRRLALIYVKKGDFENAWRMLEWMEAIVEALQPLEYPEALVPGVRRKLDVARRLVDETMALLVDLEHRRSKPALVSRDRSSP